MPWLTLTQQQEVERRGRADRAEPAGARPFAVIDGIHVMQGPRPPFPRLFVAGRFPHSVVLRDNDAAALARRAREYAASIQESTCPDTK